MGSSWTPAGRTGSLRQGDQPDGAPLGDIPIGNTFEPCPEMAVGSLRGGDRGVVDTHFTKGRGAGRTFEYTFPAPVAVQLTTGTGIDGLSRYGTVNTIQETQQQDPASVAALVYKGRVAFKMTSLAGLTVLRGPILGFSALAGGAKHKGDYACWRVKALLAAEPAGTGDLGLVLTAGGFDAFRNGTAPGFSLRPLADNTISFRARSVIGVDYQADEEAPIETDVSEYNGYEFRIVGATDTENALLKVYVNRVLLFTYDFSEGELPADGLLYVAVTSRASGVLYLPIGGGHVAAAYDEASTL